MTVDGVARPNDARAHPFGLVRRADEPLGLALGAGVVGRELRCRSQRLGEVPHGDELHEAPRPGRRGGRERKEMNGPVANCAARGVDKQICLGRARGCQHVGRALDVDLVAAVVHQIVTLERPDHCRGVEDSQGTATDSCRPGSRESINSCLFRRDVGQFYSHSRRRRLSKLILADRGDQVDDTDSFGRYSSLNQM